MSQQRSTDIVNLVTKIETEMGKFKYSRLKKVNNIQSGATTLSR